MPTSLRGFRPDRQDYPIDFLRGFLRKPKDFAKGTKMAFAGMSKGADRANLVAYLQGIGG